MKGILELAGAVSHELKQPMQAIFSTIDLMELKNTIDEAEKGKRMEAIVDFIDRMKDIINRLNNLTKYETRPYTGTTINYSHLKANWNP